MYVDVDYGTVPSKLHDADSPSFNLHYRMPGKDGGKVKPLKQGKVGNPEREYLMQEGKLHGCPNLTYLRHCTGFAERRH